jgi:uncharacterized membrane protein (UPF0182 family)
MPNFLIFLFIGIIFFLPALRDLKLRRYKSAGTFALLGLIALAGIYICSEIYLTSLGTTAFDNDMYHVIADGKIYFIWDAYTTATTYPYSQPLLRNVNYIRNSVKVVVDAYEGSVYFYVADKTDPVLQAYAKTFSSLFKPLEAIQQGSQVRFGNLLAVPLSGYRIMYIQPIYIQASVGKMPELRRVVVVFGDQLAYGASFEEALGKFFPQISGSSSYSARKLTATTEEKTVGRKNLVAAAAKAFENYRDFMGKGKYEEAGKALEELGRILNQLK